MPPWPGRDSLDRRLIRCSSRSRQPSANPSSYIWDSRQSLTFISPGATPSQNCPAGCDKADAREGGWCTFAAGATPRGPQLAHAAHACGVAMNTQGPATRASPRWTPVHWHRPRPTHSPAAVRPRMGRQARRLPRSPGGQAASGRAPQGCAHPLLRVETGVQQAQGQADVVTLLHFSEVQLAQALGAEAALSLQQASLHSAGGGQQGQALGAAPPSAPHPWRRKLLAGSRKPPRTPQQGRQAATGT